MRARDDRRPGAPRPRGRISRAAAAAIVGVAAIAGSSAQPVAAQPADDVQQLAERYAPIVMVRTQAEACSEDGEPFVPMSVEHLLDNPQVALRQLGSGDPTMMRGPGAADLSELGAGFYLDVAGDALDPGCIYEQDNDRLNAGQPAVVYAHVVQQPDRPDEIALQYWLYWYYNDWNNKHESDWEFIQLVFPASSVAEALTTEPVAVGYAQHEGGERADWQDDKLRREGDHPVVYSSQRSHASYYGAAVYMGRSGSEGFGCDNTDDPSTRIEPDVVVLPDRPAGADDPLAWIGFEGRWGERHSGPNNGPTGPNTKPQWTAPLTWQDGLRDSSFVVPAGDTGAAQVIDAFCGVVAWGSVQYIRLVASPARALLVLVVLAAAVGFLARRTRWGVVPAFPLRRARRGGEILRLAGHEYRRHPAIFVPAALIAVAVAALAALAGAVLSRTPLIAGFVDVPEETSSGFRVLAASIVGTVVLFLPFTLVSAFVTCVADRATDERLPLGPAWRTVRARIADLLAGLLWGVLVLAALSVTVVGAPIAAWLFVRWQFLPQVVVLEGRRGRRALATSGRLVRGRWWHTALMTAVALTSVSVLGIAVGLVVLVLFTGLPLWALSAIVAACNVLVMPFGALVMTYLYGNAAAEEAPTTSPEPAEVLPA